MSQLSGTRDHAVNIVSDGPLSTTNVQAALAALAAQGLFTETFTAASYTPGESAGSPTTLTTFDLANATTGHLVVCGTFSFGTAAAPTSTVILILATASRTSGGVLSFAAPTSITSEDISLHVHWEADGGQPALRFHYHGGGAAPESRVTLLYSWIEQAVP